MHSIAYVSGVWSSIQVATNADELSIVLYSSANSFGVGTALLRPGALVLFGAFPFRGTVVVVGLGAIVVVGDGAKVVSVGIDDVVVTTGVSSSTKFAIVTVPPSTFDAVKDSRIPPEEMPGCAWLKRAANPATCGAAIEVPEIVRVAEAPEIQADVIPVPGAYISTHPPKFE